MITTNLTIGKNFIVWAEKPEGPWSEPIWLDWPGIDPSLLFDEDGKIYLTGTQDIFRGEPSGIYQAQIDVDTGEILSERRLIWQGTGGAHPEGPHLYKIKDYYYLMIAEGGTEYGHMVTIARSKQPFGPFESHPDNPILTHRSSASPIQATGHADSKKYTFSYQQQQDGDSTILGSGECSLLSTEVADGFTGVYFGLYAVGNGHKESTPAYFDWFNYSI